MFARATSLRLLLSSIAATVGILVLTAGTYAGPAAASSGAHDAANDAANGSGRTSRSLEVIREIAAEGVDPARQWRVVGLLALTAVLTLAAVVVVVIDRRRRR